MSHIELLPDWNVHHIWWPKNQYNTRFEKAFRNATENKIAVPTRNHNFLHHKVAPPSKPTKNQMFEIMDILESTEVDEQEDRYWAIRKNIEYFGALAVEKTYNNYIAKNISDNMTHQLGILTMRLVTIGEQNENQEIHRPIDTDS